MVYLGTNDGPTHSVWSESGSHDRCSARAARSDTPHYVSFMDKEQSVNAAKTMET